MGELSGIELPRMYWLAADLPTEFASFRQYCELIFRGQFADKDDARDLHMVVSRSGKVVHVREPTNLPLRT